MAGSTRTGYDTNARLAPMNEEVVVCKSSHLPGFRDLRAPLTAGYLWLLLLWIVIKPDISKRPTNSVVGSVYDLAKDAGPIWIGLGVAWPRT
jgi:hypothetical protein